MHENGDSTLSVLIKSFPGFDKFKITDRAETAFSTPETFSLMNKYENAIGFGPYDIAKNSEAQIIKVDGRDPTFSGYPSVTTLGFVYQEKSLQHQVQQTCQLLSLAEFRSTKKAHKGRGFSVIVLPDTLPLTAPRKH